MIEPPVSEPTAIGASPAATATAEPELEPDGLRPVPYGFSVSAAEVSAPDVMACCSSPTVAVAASMLVPPMFSRRDPASTMVEE